jgi:hypothetical protein
MSAKYLLRSFAGGEITPELAGRLDLAKYQTGLALARNFTVLPHGPVARRPGFEFIRAAGDSTHPVRLIPFTFSADQTVVLEFGHQYIRFHIGGATLLAGSPAAYGAGTTYELGDMVSSGGVNYYCIAATTGNAPPNATYWYAMPASGEYQIPSPFNGADLMDLHHAQSADVITIAHPGYAVRELRRLGATKWTLVTASFAAPSTAPTSVSASPTVAVNEKKTTQKYVVTAVAADGVTESLPSEPAEALNNLTLQGNYNTIAWVGVSGSSRYNVYRLRGGVYGYIGQVAPSPTPTATTVNIASVTQGALFISTTKVTVNTATSHGLTTGEFVLIAGLPYAWQNGYFKATVVDSDTFTYVSLKSSKFAVSAGVGTVTSDIDLKITDDNVLPDTTTTPPEDIIELNSGANDYPAATTYHEQRRWFAGTTDKPQVLWATRTGTDGNLTSSIPSRDADGMELRIASSQYNQIRHLVALSDLIALTAGGEFRIYAENAPAITPTSVSIKPQGYAGAINVQPVATTGSILYVQAQGSRIRELSYSWEANSYRTVDASIMAPHRFNGYTVTDLAYTRAPDSTLWAVRNDGVLLGMTYVPDQQVYGWHAHDTADGLFESVCVVPENNEDVLYAVVRRTIGANQYRYIERLRTRIFTDPKDAFFVDSGLTYDGAPVTTLSGLGHLEGKTVDILADGAVHAQRTVTGGAVTLDYAASVVHVGLPMTSDLRTLPLAMEGVAAAGQGTTKNVNKVHLRVAQSSVVKAGPTFTRLREYPARAVTDPYGSPPALRDGELSLSIDPSWNQDGAVCIRQDLPLPLTVLSMTLELQSGG